MDKKQKFRTIITYKDYFENFFVKQRQKVKDKIIWTFDLIEEIDRVPETYLKHMDDTDVSNRPTPFKKINKKAL